MPSVSVLHARGWHHLHFVKFAKAKKMVLAKEAEWIDEVTIRYKDAQRPADDPLQCGQADAYELSAIDKHPRFFAGGLTRNEHKPAPIPKFKGARVGH